MYYSGTFLVTILSGAILSLLPPATFVRVFSSGPTVPARQPLEPSGADYHRSYSALGLLETLQGLKRHCEDRLSTERALQREHQNRCESNLRLSVILGGLGWIFLFLVGVGWCCRRCVHVTTGHSIQRGRRITARLAIRWVRDCW